MVEKREQHYQEIDVRQMSEQILAKNRDLLNIEMPEVTGTLLPRIESYLAEIKQNVWLSEGQSLTMEQECGMNLFLDVINFCFKDPLSGHEYCFESDDGKKIKRASGFTAALARSGVDWNNFAEVSKISVSKWLQMTQISETNPMYLGGERLLRVKGFAEHLLSLGYHNMDELLSGCSFDTSSLLNILDQSGYFNDDFQKRSQLACRMINEVWVRHGGKRFTGIEKLTVMADYRIPQIFYNLGVVSINDFDLMDKLMKERVIEANSPEEKVLRATAVVVGQIVASELEITEAEADGILWGLSQDMVKKGEMVIPHMIVATDAY